jgi:ubiquitin-like protein Pup
LAKRERVERTKKSSKKEETTPQEVKSSDTQALKDELDKLLDAIDAVLETNAEEFVKGYVQKGGE